MKFQSNVRKDWLVFLNNWLTRVFTTFLHLPRAIIIVCGPNHSMAYLSLRMSWHFWHCTNRSGGLLKIKLLISSIKKPSNTYCILKWTLVFSRYEECNEADWELIKEKYLDSLRFQKISIVYEKYQHILDR